MHIPIMPIRGIHKTNAVFEQGRIKARELESIVDLKYKNKEISFGEMIDQKIEIETNLIKLLDENPATE